MGGKFREIGLKYELRLFVANAFPILKLIMTRGAVGTINKVFGMTRVRNKYTMFLYSKSITFTKCIKKVPFSKGNSYRS